MGAWNRRNLGGLRGGEARTAAEILRLQLPAPKPSSWPRRPEIEKSSSRHR